MGGFIEIAAFAFVSSKIKANANGASTYLQVAKVRFGTIGHLAYMFAALVANFVVGSEILIGGAGVIAGLTGISQYAAEGKPASKPNNPKKFEIPEKVFTIDKLDKHSGGPQAIMDFMGRDTTEEFEMLHDDEVILKYTPQQVIGRVKGAEPTLEI
ncbi:uncharacterized protein B0I36DRAFT_369170 [Microdochium trichocladiopsis]|uniref:Cytochrome b5 heme-binding domain-containing protein n=1 Tax=Microdochium trichocladiopsis TaxID=1682393 RepID=A0A9P8XTA0_9PEZI|nr:uncharacterized protein B0I36DRAFT_369170 [Microdochium trichocladiopsis]KAH7014181.1 hypothetical protein B0I36DRAFT_369170 [Microdochium trichocladiopsis]